MPSPFSGMNPYLESPDLWTKVHHRLISAIADAKDCGDKRDYKLSTSPTKLVEDKETNSTGI